MQDRLFNTAGEGWPVARPDRSYGGRPTRAVTVSAPHPHSFNNLSPVEHFWPRLACRSSDRLDVVSTALALRQSLAIANI